ncbi:MAG: hypothetical protein ACRD8U_24210 [Pyrinomonadaceae bacterium]
MQIKEASQHPLILLLVGSVLSSLLIPGISARSTEAQLIQETRLKKALEVGIHNREFDSKLNGITTLMKTFHNQNVRMKFNPVELRQAQNAFRKDYTDRYLALNETAWWWYWDIQREARLLKLTSASDDARLDQKIKEYGDSTTVSVGAIAPMWKFLSSYEYRIDDGSQVEFIKLEKAMDEAITTQYKARGTLVQDMAKIFAEVQ